ncbi:ectonucleotide pyrophosphatase/phosphodiesterase [Telmatospirillum sp.]|uniref:alkaline phosphatase family protein n=1 Tax=Telmatospirillum sp. TaxID=2079197 RepID=UPI002840F4C0|nr:ectonucleotide pyrophosphatase/phosphodiesterase [Telmatospirillum sp.]MDR3439126.1 ectonucleotide pyrophosphatase/phosphodiesterase [Telmatospirillum sp.]
MNPSFVRLLVLVLTLSLAGCADRPAPSSTVQPGGERLPLILVSLDGFRPDYLERGLTPTLSGLAAAGVAGEGMRPAFPSLTFPNHYTLVTGLYPDHHGIVANRMEDPALAPKSVFSLGDRDAVEDPRWWNGATPLWVTAHRQGLRTATMFWPGSDVAIQGVRPDYWEKFDASLPPERRVDKVLEWLDLPVGQRPDFITLYFEHVDTAGHRFGPQSEGVDQSLRQVDGALARLLAGLQQRHLADRVNLVIVADHGMTLTALDRIVFLDDLVDIDTVHVVNSGPEAELSPLPGHEAAVEAGLLALHEHVACWRKEDIPARLHYGSHPRVPSLLCLADSGWLVESRADLRRELSKGKPFIVGRHGYDPAVPDMAALFIAKGPAFRERLRQPPFDNVDLYPLLTRLLGLVPEPNDGKAETLAEILW